MTEPTPKGYAALITIDWVNQDVMWTIFEEEAGKRDPLLSAKALAKSVEADWPNHEQHIIGNARAGQLQAKRILGFDPFEVVEPEPTRDPR